MKFNKEIFEVKLSITNDCNFKCKYCFVAHGRLAPMDSQTGKNAIDFVLNTPGKEKIIKVYGGEPLLNYGLIKEITPYSLTKAKELNKNLTLSLCSNLSLMTKEQIIFFKKNNYQLALSFDGRPETYTRYRGTNYSADIYKQVLSILKNLVQTIPARNLAVNIALVPDEAKNLYANFRFIYDLGIDTMNIEPIFGYQHWGEKEQTDFKRNLEAIYKFIQSELLRGNFIFLTAVNRELKYRTLSRIAEQACYFFYSTEIAANGDISLNSFMLNNPNKKVRNRFWAGNVKEKNLNPKYIACAYSSESKQCSRCLKLFDKIIDTNQSGQMVHLRDLYAISFADLVRGKKEKSEIYRKYQKEACQHICF